MKFRKIFTSILLLLTSLLLISCNKSVSEDTIKKIEADINAIEELTIENNLLNLPNKGLVNGSDITWEIDFDNVVNNNIVIPSNHPDLDRKSTRLNSSHVRISYAVFCLKKK